MAEANFKATSPEVILAHESFQSLSEALSVGLRRPAQGVKECRAGGSRSSRSDFAAQAAKAVDESARISGTPNTYAEMLVSLDSECEAKLEVGEYRKMKKNKKTKKQNGVLCNKVLSYQYAAKLVGGGGCGAFWQGMFRDRAGKRMSLSTFLAGVIQVGLKAGHLRSRPKALTLIGHWTLADLAMFSDFPKLKLRFDSIRNTYLTLSRPLKVKVTLGGHAYIVLVTLRDSMLLTPGASQSLASLGALLGLEKVELGDGQIERMEELQARDPELFQRYAMRDTQICLAHAERLRQLNLELTGVAGVPVTLSSLGVHYLLRLWKDADLCTDAILGTREEHERVWNHKTGCSLPRKRRVSHPRRHLHEAMATECYSGGHNVGYTFGAGLPGPWSDLDLASAYTAVMSLLGMPDWDLARVTLDLADFGPGTFGFAWVKFFFPGDTRFPSLPVRTDHGLVFPLTGASYCCASEISLALSMGATVEILHGVVIPCDDSVHPFEMFVAECTRRRGAFPKGDVNNALWKELGNSTYGQLAQGTRPKRRFDSRSGQHHALPPGRISNPFMAAWITSFVRAVVGEILHSLPRTASVCSVTTDGFLTNASASDITAATTGPLCQLFSAARLRLTGNPQVLEAKHQILQPLGIRTRGQATLVPDGDHEVVLAKAGIKPPMKDKTAQNDWLVGLFVNRDADTRVTYSQLRSLQDLYRDGGDLVSLTVERRASLDYDFKRDPIGECMRDIRGVPHLAFDTRPWPDVDAFLECRAHWEVFRRQRVLKTITDLEDFRAFCLTPQGRSVRTTAPRGGVKVALRIFLRAWTRNRWGLDSTVMNYPELAYWLTAAGYPCRREDVENAQRSSTKLLEHSVPGTPAVLKFIAVVTAQFPGFEGHHLLLPDAAPGQFPRL